MALLLPTLLALYAPLFVLPGFLVLLLALFYCVYVPGFAAEPGCAGGDIGPRACSRGHRAEPAVVAGNVRVSDVALALPECVRVSGCKFVFAEWLFATVGVQ